MEAARLSVRVDSSTKEQAEQVFDKLGLTLSSGINIFLSKVAAIKGIPFQLTIEPNAQAHSIEDEARLAVHSEIDMMTRENKPIALYDAKEKRPYFLIKGKKVYDIDGI
ncbi:MAG: type II toxin-antitoxin system RelB/DinJ family antitoxin [Coriobacteriales bacterium]|jgi:DNA-damage-inducible protein J|nr:type II toxin-antitoxin system RelB/DinJ family antitoxin [Coriobacteriales bacterium]